MLASVKVPVLLTHHFRVIDAATGVLMGALSDLHAARVRQLIEAAGQQVEYRSFPTMGHAMHQQDPALFVATLVEWTAKLP
jgi:pimeloyl-ACP methyl ester carboxylesterase